MNGEQIKKTNLDEVSFIRPILIILLILVHCFTCFNHGWEPFSGFQENSIYMWLSRLCYSFLLEAFVFISGYVYAYQILTQHKTYTITKLVNDKTSRLLLPSLIFSLIYIQVFNVENFTNVDSLYGYVSLLVSLVSGVGHLWYLPMLFWCFIFMWMIERVSLSERLKLIILLLLSILPYVYLPFQLYRVPYYLFFFYMGYKMWEYRSKYIQRVSIRTIIKLGGAFMVAFIVLRSLKAEVVELSITMNLPLKAVLKVLSNTCTLIYSSLGLISIFFISILYTQKHKLKTWYVSLGNMCFGIYIFQEFIIKYLYYYTDIGERVSYLVLPWIVFIITTVTSILLSKSTKTL